VHSVELGSETISFLAPVFSHGSTIAQGVATRLLGDMVAKRLATAGHGRIWEEFKRDPANRASTERILRQILREDSEFQTQLKEALIAAMQESARNSEQHGSIHISGPGQAQIGNRGDTIEGNRIANRGGIYNERTRISNKTTKKTPGGPVVLLGAVVLIALVILLITGVSDLLHGLGGGGLGANSTCQDFLNASPAAQQQAVYNLAAQYHVPDFATPLGPPNVTEYCASDLSATVGQFFANAQSQQGG
jgi:hypothetical protein